MFTRISSAFLLLTLAACGEGKNDTMAAGPGVSNQSADAANAGHILCAPGGTRAFEPVCGIDRSNSEAGVVLTVRHPDEGFRRLLIATDGSGIVAADGAEPAEVTLISEEIIEIAIGDDRYRLPATLTGAER